MRESIQNMIDEVDFNTISSERKKELQPFINYIKDCKQEEVQLNFICTHNSRRSQFSQVWAKVASDYFNVPAKCFSGGVEVTAFNERAVASVKRFGFEVNNDQGDNPKYELSYSEEAESIICFSKLFDDATSPKSDFAAIMTCSHADENCPYIPGAEARIPVRYNDPKEFDDTDQEEEMYDKRSREIATEMFYCFSKVV